MSRVDLSPVILHTLLMSRAREAFELASDRQRAMKVLIDFAPGAGWRVGREGPSAAIAVH